MTRKSIKGIFTQSMDAGAAKPVIENSKLRGMDDPMPASKASRGTKAASEGKGLMDARPSKTPVIKKAGATMEPFVADRRKEKTPLTFDDQKAKAQRRSADDSYVVLRMHVQNGEMTVVGSKRVDGPLAEYAELVQSGLTYEATIDNTRLAIGSVADFGERRSYPRPGEHEHHVSVLPSFQFNLKIPAARLAAKDLPKLKVSLFRFKELLPETAALTVKPLSVQFEREARVVAELNGIYMADLKSDVKDTIRRTFAK